MELADFKDLGLTDSEIENLAILLRVVLDYPADVQQIVRESGQEPSNDPEILVYQLIEAKALEESGSFGFDSTVFNYADDNAEFLGGLGLAIGKIAGGAVSLFKKKKGREGGKGFIGRALDKWKEKRAAKKAADAAKSGRTVEGSPPVVEGLPEVTITPGGVSMSTAEWAKVKADLASLEKAKKGWMIAGIGLAVGLVGAIIWAVSK